MSVKYACELHHNDYKMIKVPEREFRRQNKMGISNI